MTQNITFRYLLEVRIDYGKVIKGSNSQMYKDTHENQPYAQISLLTKDTIETPNYTIRSS